MKKIKLFINKIIYEVVLISCIWYFKDSLKLFLLFVAIAAQVIDVAPAPIVIILADIRRLVYFNFRNFYC